MRTNKSLVIHLLRTGALCAAATAAAAGESGSFADAIHDTKPIIDARLRYEGVDQDGFANEATALTLRARLGFETGKVLSTSLLAEGEAVWPWLSDYDSTTNGNSAYPVVADPESYEINRLQLANTALPQTTITLGRQRIGLDDQRFVGNAGWRQNEQTFDSVRVVNKSVSKMVFDLAYVSQVNRVFGKESAQGRYEGDSVLANVSYQFPLGKLTAFGYSLEFDPIANVPAAARDSALTLGARFAGEKKLDAVKLVYSASYATQKDAGANPLSFDLGYYLAELSGTWKSYSLGAGIETLEGNGVKGFSAPLGSLHKFQGWADKFLNTPADGIADKYLTASINLPKLASLDGFSATAAFHAYDAERSSRDYGSELDLQLQAKWHRFNGVVKYADYDADTFAADTAKFWVQLEYLW